MRPLQRHGAASYLGDDAASRGKSRLASMGGRIASEPTLERRDETWLSANVRRGGFDYSEICAYAQ